ncbi:hypothetical protein ACSLOP_30120, partial [Escherichia coli]
MAYADQKLCENFPCCLCLTLSRRPAIIRFVILNTKKGLRPYFKQLPDNYQAKFELNLMSKFSNFIINKPFSAINN